MYLNMLTAALIAATSLAAGQAVARCADYGSVRSTDSDTKYDIEFVNRTRQDVRVFWIDYDGALRLKEELRPGEAVGHSSYATHPFIVLDAANKCRGLTVISRNRRSVVAR